MIDIIKSVISDGNYKKHWSIAVDGNLSPAYSSFESAICQACTNRSCLKSEQTVHYCEIGLVSYTKKVHDVRIVIYGYLNNSVAANKQTQKFMKGRTLEINHVNSWFESLDRTIHEINNVIEYKKSQILHHFHDPAKWAESIQILTEKIIRKRSDLPLAESIESATSDVKSLYHAASMLVQSVDTLNVVMNPSSASYGDTNAVCLYQLFDKIQAIIYQAEAKQVNKKFKLRGQSRKRVHVHKSFQVIALCLIQNAFKYSLSNEIDIEINDTDHGISVKVTNVGPLISAEELNFIFNKGYRSNLAKKVQNKGTGTGLYAAQTIANAHGFSIKARSETLNASKDNIPLANNTFSFEINT